MHKTRGFAKKTNTIKRLIAHLRKVRYFIYLLIVPFDKLFLRINRLGRYPPIHLRRHVHLLGTIDGTNAEFAVYLKVFAHLKSTDKLLDLGCGCGLLELSLEDYFTTGEVVGIDIHKPCIDWAKKSIEKRRPNFHFVHADIYNAAYWTKGKLDVQTFFEELPFSNFDVAVAKSLFTHMLPGEMGIYIEEISNRLKKGGRVLATFFLLNKEQQELARNGKNQIEFLDIDSSEVYAVRNKYAPTAGVAYLEDYILELFTENALVPENPPIYGGWAGRNNAIHYQDIVVFTKK